MCWVRSVGDTQAGAIDCARIMTVNIMFTHGAGDRFTRVALICRDKSGVIQVWTLQFILPPMRVW